MAEENNKHNNVLKKVMSKYLVIKIFEHLKHDKLLKIIQYNKEYQYMMNINLEDYKNEFSKIEIEVIPRENEYGKFINIPLLKNIHIFFNDNEEEVKKKNITKDDKVKKIKIIIDYNIRALSWFFREFNCIRKIIFINFNKDNITNMYSMFSYCTSLEEINFINFNTNNVTNMSELFFDCPLLIELNLSNFNTNKVTNMNKMFYNCRF